MVEHVHGVMTIIYLLQMPVRQQRAIVQESIASVCKALEPTLLAAEGIGVVLTMSLINISDPTRLRRISYAVLCLKKKKYTERCNTRMFRTRQRD